MLHTIRGQHKPKITSLHASTRRILLEILSNSLKWTLRIPQHSGADTNRLLSMKYVYNYEYLNILKSNNVIRETSRTTIRPIVKVHLWHACQRFRNTKHRLGPGNIRKNAYNQENALPTDKLQKTIPNAQMRGRNYLTLIYMQRTSQNRITEWRETKS
jgi:hypothetical protein